MFAWLLVYSSFSRQSKIVAWLISLSVGQATSTGLCSWSAFCRAMRTQSDSWMCKTGSIMRSMAATSRRLCQQMCLGNMTIFTLRIVSPHAVVYCHPWLLLFHSISNAISIGGAQLYSTFLGFGSGPPDDRQTGCHDPGAFVSTLIPGLSSY